jgi:hypothetical protein
MNQQIRMVPIDPPEEGTPDPPWIRDLESAAVCFCVRTDADFNSVLMELFTGQINFCEQCGQDFPAWPPTEYAQHFCTAHASENSVQQMRGMSALAGSWGPDNAMAFIHYVNGQLMSRVSLRRRAWKLGLLAMEQEPSRIHRPGVN